MIWMICTSAGDFLKERFQLETLTRRKKYMSELHKRNIYVFTILQRVPLFEPRNSYASELRLNIFFTELHYFMAAYHSTKML